MLEVTILQQSQCAMTQRGKGLYTAKTSTSGGGDGSFPVVCLVGDGAAMYSPQALWTAAHESLPETFVVMNNREYNILKNFKRSKTEYMSGKTNRCIAMDLDRRPIDTVALGHRHGRPGPAEAGMASGTTNLVEITIGRS